MKRALLVITLLIVVFGAAACAPSQAMVATLTMLPGTPTATRLPQPSRTPRQITPTPLNQPTSIRATAADTITPADCPAGTFDFAPPEDASRMAGLSYDLNNLPAAFELQDHGLIDNGTHRWAWVRWDDRSLFWIERLACRNITGSPHWVIIDALALPRLQRESGEAETRLCFAGSKRIPNVAGYGFFNPDSGLEDVGDGRRGKLMDLQAAWEIGRAFIPLDTSQLRCYVE